LRISAVALAALAGLGLLVLPQYLVAQAAPEIPSGTTAPGAAPNRAAVEKIVRDYLLSNPEILREMAEKLKAKDDAMANAKRSDVFKTTSSEIYNSENQVVLGNPNGDVTLVEFFDYNCGYCKHALEDTNELLKTDKNLRLVLKEYPVLGPDSVDAARVAVGVSKQAPEKYLDFHRKLLSAESATGASAIEIARGLGLDIDRLSKDLTDPSTEAALVSVHKLANRLNINGTPTYVIADQVLPGAAGADTLKEIIGNVRKCGKAECS
jgi:protein-disulfide isomerase